MESDDGHVLHGYGLRSHGPDATDPASFDAMVGASWGLAHRPSDLSLDQLRPRGAPALGARTQE
jgi:hypothetical protein